MILGFRNVLGCSHELALKYVESDVEATVASCTQCPFLIVEGPAARLLPAADSRLAPHTMLGHT